MRKLTSEDKYIRKRRIKANVSKLLYYMFGILPIHKNKITFSAFEGAGYCCNPKYIAEELIESQRNGNVRYELVWLVNDLNKDFPPEIKKSKKYIVE